MIGSRRKASTRPCGTAPFRLGERIDVHPLTNVIVRDGTELPVEPRVMELLVYLASRPGEIVSKGELMERVWNAHVVDEAVHRAVSLLRSALGDSPHRSIIVGTVPRRGYRLLIRPAPLSGPGWTAGKSRLMAAGVALAVVAVVAVMLVLPLFIGADATRSPARTSSPVMARAASLPALPAADAQEAPAAASRAATAQSGRAAPQVALAAPEAERSSRPGEPTTPESAPNWAPSAPRAAPRETPAPPTGTAPAPQAR